MLFPKFITFKVPFVKVRAIQQDATLSRNVTRPLNWYFHRTINSVCLTMTLTASDISI